MNKNLARIQTLTDMQIGVCEHMSVFLEEVPVGIIVADDAGRFVIWNDEAKRLVGKPPYVSTPEEWTEIYDIYQDQEHAERGELMPWADLPLVRAMKGETIHAERIFMNGKVVSCNARSFMVGVDAFHAACFWEIVHEV